MLLMGEKLCSNFKIMNTRGTEKGSNFGALKRALVMWQGVGPTCDVMWYVCLCFFFFFSLALQQTDLFIYFCRGLQRQPIKENTKHELTWECTNQRYPKSFKAQEYALLVICSFLTRKAEQYHVFSIIVCMYVWKSMFSRLSLYIK